MLTTNWYHHHCEARLRHDELLREAALRRLARRLQAPKPGGLRSLIRAVWRSATTMFVVPTLERKRTTTVGRS